MMQQDERQAVLIVNHYHEVLQKSVSGHGGNILNDYGDGSLCAFSSATLAVQCAIEIQKLLQSDPPVPLRIGLHVGEIFFEAGKVMGDGVNIATRIQSLGLANTIPFSKEIFDKIRNQSEFKAISLGLFEFKNVDDPVEVFALDIPIASNTVVSSKEHASGYRHSTHAFGVGDLRFTVYKWLLNTNVPRKGNIQFGLDLKFPTGNYQTVDYFYSDPANPFLGELAPVNVAIQLGDGGTGITAELNAFYIFNRSMSFYGNFFYLISPKDQNGVKSFQPNILPPAAVKLFHETTNDVNSIPDNYTLRVGVNFTFDRWVATADLRYEGAPAHDLIGENDGFRKVGYIFSVEPGIQYKLKTSYLYAFVTIPVDRATIQTVPNERQESITGVPTTTPGHFANWVMFIGYTFTF